MKFKLCSNSVQSLFKLCSMFKLCSKTSNLSHLGTCNPSATPGDHQVSTPYHMVQLLATIQCHYLGGYNSDLFWGPNSNFQPVSHPYLDSLGKFQRCTFLIWTPKSSLCAIGQVSLETSHGKMDYRDRQKGMAVC